MDIKQNMLVAGAIVAVTTLASCGLSSSSNEDQNHASAPTVTRAAHSHATQGETCFICDATKRDAGRLWCRGHGRYEDRCWLCHPELEDPDRAYCTEHYLYEDECFLCDPNLANANAAVDHSDDDHDHDHDDEDHGTGGDLHAGHDHGGDSGAHSIVNGALWCNEHGVAEMECAICQPQLTETLAVGGEMKIRFASAESTDKAGVRTGRAQRTDSTAASVTAYCEVRLDQNNLAQITPLAAGVIRQVFVDVGSKVEPGMPLVELNSSEVASLKSDYLAAHVQYELRSQSAERERKLVQENIGARRELEEAEAALRLARLELATCRQRLVNIGLTNEEVQRVIAEEDASSSFIVRAPSSGTIVNRRAVVGESAVPGESLLTQAALDRVWIELSVPAELMGALTIGAEVRATFAALPGREVIADLTWIDATIDEKTRMVRARAVAANEDGLLRAGLFGQARITGAPGVSIWRVPREAVQRVDGTPFIFIRLEPDLYAARRITLAATNDRFAEVLTGLSDREDLVIDGAYVVLSEMLKSRLGAGCADH